MDKQIALKFSCADQSPDENKISVILEIHLQSTKNFFVMDTEDYHAFWLEREVLLQEGLQFKIIDIKEENNYQLVQLFYKH